MAFWRPLRTALHFLLLLTSIALLGLTAFRIHTTRNSNVPDIFSGRTHFSEGRIIELLVASILGTIICLWFIHAIFRRFGGSRHHYSELLSLFVLWCMFLIGAALTTHKYSHLKQCRGIFKQCRVLEAIKALSWIGWILTSLLLPLAFLAYRRRDVVDGPHRRNKEEFAGSTGAPGVTAGHGNVNRV